MKLKEIKQKTDDYYGFDISGRCQDDNFKEPRQFFSAFARSQNHRLHNIGKELNRGHATVINAIKRYQENIYYSSYSERYAKYVLFMLDVTLFEKVKYIEVEVTDLPKPILNVCNELKKLKHSDILEFNETRLKPFINMLESKKQHKKSVTKEVNGAILRNNVKNPFLSHC